VDETGVAIRSERGLAEDRYLDYRFVERSRREWAEERTNEVIYNTRTRLSCVVCLIDEFSNSIEGEHESCWRSILYSPWAAPERGRYVHERMRKLGRRGIVALN
jgi:hypothetical protein